MFITLEHHGLEWSHGWNGHPTVRKEVTSSVVVFQDVFPRPLVDEIVVAGAYPVEAEAVYLQCTLLSYIHEGAEVFPLRVGKSFSVL